MRSLLISISAIVILTAGCKQAEEKGALEETAVNVRIHPVAYQEYKVPVRAAGILGTSTRMKLSFKTGGLISQIDVREGESVEEGQILALLDLSEIEAQVNQARIGYEKARRDMTRAENLYKDSVATLEQFQNARSAFEVAGSQKQIADFNLLHSQIKAPSDGEIQKIMVETNEMIAPGHPAVLFASTEDDWVVRVALTDKDIVKLLIGDSAHVFIDAFPGEVMHAEITELGAIADPVTGTYEAELLIVKSKSQFRTGFIARAKIYPSSTERSLLVPLKALLDANDHTASVYTYEDGKAEKRRIRTGMITKDAVVVSDGLREGEFVITDGVTYLGKDSKVKLLSNPETVDQ
jgi:RND family efflux transporter MFP subunit